LLATLLGLLAFVAQPFVQPVSSRVPPADPARLRAAVEHLSVALYPRSFGSANLDKAGRYIRDSFASVGARPEVQEFQVDGERFFNISARFGPKEGKVVVVGAHYDSHGDSAAAAMAERAFTKSTHTPGADDNASGVAGLIELARLLVAHPPSRPVELVAYTLEEPPHFRTDDMGSARHARALRSQEVELMISLEMIGYFSDAPGSQTYPVPGLTWLYPDTGNFIALVSRPQDWRETRRLKALMRGAANLPVRSINAFPVIPGIDFSDHLNYWAHGMPAVMVTDTAFNRNLEYHGPGDTFERLEYAKMAEVVQGVLAFLVASPAP
jgi:Zn-dependent M28 family amino/carboxypeptidase